MHSTNNIWMFKSRR